MTVIRELVAAGVLAFAQVGNCLGRHHQSFGRVALHDVIPQHRAALPVQHQARSILQQPILHQQRRCIVADRDPKARILANVAPPFAFAVAHDREAGRRVLHRYIVSDDRVGIPRGENALAFVVGEGAVGDRRRGGLNPNRRAANFLVGHGHAPQLRVVREGDRHVLVGKGGAGEFAAARNQNPVALIGLVAN